MLRAQISKALSIKIMTHQSNVRALNALCPLHSSPKKMATGSHVPSETIKEQIFQNVASSTKDRTFAEAHPFAQHLTIWFVCCISIKGKRTSFIYVTGSSTQNISLISSILQIQLLLCSSTVDPVPQPCTWLWKEFQHLT